MIFERKDKKKIEVQNSSNHDMDYVRALLEIDREVAIEEISGLRTPRVQYYTYENNVIKHFMCFRETLIEKILENKENIFI